MQKKALTPKCPRSSHCALHPRWLRPALIVAFLLGLLTLRASAQTPTPAINDFTDGYTTNASSDSYPGFAGDDTMNTPGTGWSSQWSYDPSSANRTQLTGETVINTYPMNGGGNYLNWYSWNPGDSGGGATIYRIVNTNIPSTTFVDVTKPWGVEFDWRLDYHLEDVTGHSNAVLDFGVTNGTGSSSTAFSGRQDQFQWFNSDHATSGDTGGGGSYWVKLAAANTTKANSLVSRQFGFWDAGTTQTAENHGVYVNATNVSFIATNTIYHFKFLMDPSNYTYEGFITNVNNGVGFSTTASAGRKLRSRNNVPVVFPWWTNGPTLNTAHTNPCNYIDWEARSQNGVAALAGSKAGWCPTNFMSLDNLIVYQVPSSNFPPVLTLINPHLNHTFYPASSNFMFSALTYATGKTLPASGVILTLNGVNVSAGLTFTGSDSDTNRTVTYSGLLDNTLYTAGVSVADSGGVVTSNFFRFDTFNTNTAITIETENYNFDPTLTSCLSTLGQTDVQTDRFIQNWVYSGVSINGTLINPVNGYVGRPSVRGIDYSNTVNSSVNGDAEGSFRACEAGTIATYGGGTGSPGGTQINIDDDVRQVYLNFNDLGMVEVNTMKVGVGDWWNYTHIWPAGNYVAYLRGSAYNTSTKNSQGVYIPMVLNLGLVVENGVSSYTNMTQTTTNLGTFTLPIDSAVTVNSIAYTHPLVDTNGYTRVINLNGKQTFKLSVASGDVVNNDSAWVNYMVLVPVPNILISNATRISSSDYRFFFNSISNVHYTIQTNSSLTGATPWATMTTTLGTGGSVQVDDKSGSGGNLFYRVKVP